MRVTFPSFTVVALTLVFLVPEVQGQNEAPPRQAPESAEGGDQAIPTAPAPGRFRVGSLYITPYLEIGSLGFDTNVLYTPTDRQSDFTIDGGPGAEFILPIQRSSRLSVDLGVRYLYFARTESQRRLNKYGAATLEYAPGDFGTDPFAAADDRPPSRAGIAEVFQETNARINMEVDERIPRRDERTEAWLGRRLLGRLGFEVNASRLRAEALGPSDYLGVDVQASYTRDERGLAAALRYHATVKTSFALRSDVTVHHFPLAPERDARVVRVIAGPETDATALISGHVLVGFKWFNPDPAEQPTRRVPELDVDATVNFTPRTRLGLLYARSLVYSYLSAPGELPTLNRDTFEARILKELGRGFDIRVFVRHVNFQNDGAVSITEPDGSVTTERRADRGWQSGANVGFSRSRIRVGLEAAYAKRQSNIAYFGIDGLVVGLTVDYLTPVSGRHGFPTSGRQ